MGATFKGVLSSPLKLWTLVIGCVAIVVGFVAWIVTLTGGLLENSGMSNTFNWGLLIAVFAFLVGFGAGSQWVACYIVLAKREELYGYLPIAQSIALAGGCGAGVAILIDLGNPFHIMAMIIGANVVSPLFWDMITLTLFLVSAFICLVAVARKSPRLKGWMVVGCITATALQVVEGLLFALMESRVWWHSFIMPVDFLCVAAVCGLAVAAFYMAIKQRRFSIQALETVARLLMWVIVIHIVLALIDLAIVAFGGSAADAATMAALGGTWWLYAAELVLPLIAVVLLAVAVKRRGAVERAERLHGTDAESSQGKLMDGKLGVSKLLGAAGVITVIGMFCHRLMLLYPAMGSPTLFVGLSNQASPEWALPASTGLYPQIGSAFEIAQGYVPNLMEWASALFPIGVAAFLIAGCIAIVEYSMLRK